MKAKKNNISMTKCLSFCVFILLVFINCKGIPKQPVEGANQYCEDLANCAVKNDYDQAERSYAGGGHALYDHESAGIGSAAAWDLLPLRIDGTSSDE